MPDNHDHDKAGSHTDANMPHVESSCTNLRDTVIKSDTIADMAARRQILMELSYRLNPNPPPPPPPRVPKDGQRVWWADRDPPPVDLGPNVHAQPRVHSSRPLLPSAGRIPSPHEVRDTPSRQAQRRTSARANRTIRALACEAITVTLRNLLATQWVIERIEAISESKCNDITFNVMLRHYRPDFEHLAACLFSDREKEMLRCVYWETMCPYEQERLSPAHLRTFGAYLRNEPYLVRNISYQNTIYLPEVKNYEIEAKETCLLQFMYAPSSSSLLGSRSCLFNNWHYTPPGGWVEDDTEEEEEESSESEESEEDLRAGVSNAIDKMISRGDGLDMTSPLVTEVKVDYYDPRLPNHAEGFHTGEKLLTDSETEEDDDDDDYLYMATPSPKPKL